MIEHVWTMLRSLTVRDGILFGLGISIVALFSGLASRAQARRRGKALTSALSGATLNFVKSECPARGGPRCSRNE
jgi:hypothetical protein